MSAEQPRPAIQVGEWVVEPALDTITRAGETQKLEPRTMRLLMCLVDSARTVVSIERLLDDVWAGVIVSPSSVYQAVSQLRRILGDTDGEPTYIATVPRKGYRLIAPVTPYAAPQPESAATPPSTIDAPATDSSPRWRLVAMFGIALLAATAVAGLWVRKSLLVEATNTSIVVLPFIDMTAEKEDQSFCDGLTEELSNWLAQIPALRVVARTSAFAFREQGADVRKIGKALDTTRILEGSLRRSGDHMRITVQLIDARSGYHLWSATYDRAMADTIQMQEDISRSVAETLSIRLTTDTAQRFASRRSESPQAYDLYLRARHYQQERTAQSNDRALQLYRLALSADPKFALAYVGLAYALLNQNWLNNRSINDIAAEADPLLGEALRLDARLSDAYAVRGALRAEQLRNDAAQQDFGRAVKLNPNDSVAYTELGRLFLINEGRPRDALFNYTQAATLDPLNYQPQAQRCVALQDLGQFDEAATACTRARELQPEAYWPATVTSWLAAAQGRLDGALQWNEEAIKLAPDVFQLYNQRATYYLLLGLPARARDILERARVETTDVEGVNDALAQVAYYEGGPAQLRAHLAASGLDRSLHAATLFSAAYSQLLIGDAAAAKRSTERALAAIDFMPDSLESPWNAARWGHSDGLTVALVELDSGDRVSAMRRLDALAATLDRLVRNGEKRYGVDELRATVLALRGDGDGAMRALSRAADLGWRRSWWAEREPELASLWKRDDFRALTARVNAANAKLREHVSPGVGARLTFDYRPGIAASDRAASIE
ncbi:MAG: hilA 4 [Gammaproteobacteria bacterium]|nr:hilA 4 [Gammaproteobacteria bacterium]